MKSGLLKLAYLNFQKSEYYKLAVDKTLGIYEKYVLPENRKRKSLLELKTEEFNDRKRLLNPYQKEMLLLEKSNKTEILENLSK